MIVRNEEQYLPRCLASIQKYIDSWVICDTGSTDGTVHILNNFQKIIPGHLYESPWKNYGESRTEALEFAKQHAHEGDYILFIDADETFETEPGFKWPVVGLLEPVPDCYEIAMHHGELVYWRPGLIRATQNWSWHEPVHEYVWSDPPPKVMPRIAGCYKQTHPETDNRGKDKFLKHVEILEEDIKKHPNNARSWFYLAQSYKDSGNLGKAIECYEHRVKMGGFDEENYWALLQIARIKSWMKIDELAQFEAYLRAYNYRPTRVEAIGELAMFAGQRQYHHFACKQAERALQVPISQDHLFVEQSWYDWKLKDIFAINAYYIGRMDEATISCNELLTEGKLPEAERPRVEKNKAFCVQKLAELQKPI